MALSFDAPADAADAWSDALLDAGAASVDVSDTLAGTAFEAPIYGEPGVDVAPGWPTSRVEALFAADADWAAALFAVARRLELPLPPHQTRAVAEEDWVRRTQAQFGPIAVARDFWIVPSWSQVPDPAAITLRLDPGLAFGTGSHPTTRLCLLWLHGVIAGGESVLDYGCGSGILAIAAARLGAARVAGIDVDPQALRASDDNARINRVTATFVGPDALPSGRYDVVVANILTNPLRMLAPAIAARVAVGGRIALSGILEEQAPAVADAYARWFKLVPWRTSEGWVLLTGDATAAQSRD
ncbi:MAG: 50S ribosomal protein L11 methyltransferase [Burkholderiales bacterium]|nr:50S ribosomal protein L11 methyltransferase [Burkholderiales bacterium]